MDTLNGPDEMSSHVMSAVKCDSCVGGTNRCHKPAAPDAVFIAAARTDLPRALSVIEAADRLAAAADEALYGPGRAGDAALERALIAYRTARGAK